MAAFVSTVKQETLDGLLNVDGFDAAAAGTAFSFVKDRPGVPYRPVSTASTVSVDPVGGLELSLLDQLRIKPDVTSGDSGVGLSGDGLEVVDRVKTAGDTMTGVLTISTATAPSIGFGLTVLQGDGTTVAARGVNVIGGTNTECDPFQASTFDGSRDVRLSIRDADVVIRTNDGAGGGITNTVIGWGYAPNSPISVKDRRIANVDTPTEPHNAATKAYVDSMAVNSFTATGQAAQPFAAGSFIYSWGASVTPTTGKIHIGPVAYERCWLRAFTASAFSTAGVPNVDAAAIVPVINGTAHVTHEVVIPAGAGRHSRTFDPGLEMLAGQQFTCRPSTNNPDVDTSTVLAVFKRTATG